MPHFLFFYDTAPDYLARRPAYRAAHLARANDAVARGELLLAGAFDSAEGAALLFAADGPETAEAPSPAPIPTSSTASLPICG